MSISQDDIERAIDYMRDNASKDAGARADRLYLETYVKTVLAQEQAKTGASSMAAAEMTARISTPYTEALLALKQAIFEDERRRFLRAAAETKVSVFQTLSANERATRI